MVGGSVQGGCLCAAIRYRAEGDPTDRTLCHCRTCRKASAAPAVAWVTFSADQFSLVRGTPVEFRSSPRVVRTFCGTCGTPLTYRHAETPESVDVSVCSLDDPEALGPADHTWIDHRLSWMPLGDGLVTHRGSRRTR